MSVFTRESRVNSLRQGCVSENVVHPLARSYYLRVHDLFRSLYTRILTS